jgi:transposase InsO family protein
VGKLYLKLKEKSRTCRDREIRQKLELILLGLKLGNVAEACARRGYSRKFYYKWLGRLKAAHWNLEGLRERSRRPKRSPGQISEKVERRIRFYQRRQYGARMIQAMMGREGTKISTTTICHVLNRRRKPKKKKKKNLNPHRKRYELAVPGQRLQLDVKYVPEFVGGKRAYNYVAVDECTRWRFAYAYHELNEHMTFDFLEKLAENCPFPIHTIQTDNGFEFTFKLNPMTEAREHLMDTWCDQNGIRHRLIPPGAKELNGKVERSHRIDEQYFYYRAPTDTLARLNSHQARWLEFYNAKRLHGGLGYQTPNEKLLERLQTLKRGNQNFDSELEAIRLKFIEQTPTKLAEQKTGRQQSPHAQSTTKTKVIDRLHRELELALRKYNSAA